MCFFNAALLAARHRIAVVDGGSLDVIDACFQSCGVTEFRASISENGLKKRDEFKGTQSSLQTVKNGSYGAFCTAVKQESEKEAGIGEIEGKNAFKTVACRNHGIHFNEIGKTECLKVFVGPANEDFPFGDIGFLLVFPHLELHFSFQVDVSDEKDALVDVVIEGLHRDVEFRMIGKDVIRRLALFYKGFEDTVHLMELCLRYSDALSGGGKKFFVLTLGESSIIVVLISDVTAISGNVTAVTDKGSLFHPGTTLKDERTACLITEVAVSAEIVADDQLAADIGFSAAEAMDTEVIGIVERTPVPGVKGTMEFYLLGDCSGILAKVFGDIFERLPIVQGLFNVLTVIER